MWRFYVAATVLVAAFVFAITLRKAEPPDLRISARASGTPTVTHAGGGGGPGGNAAVRGDAPWALSALPDCARQHFALRGTVAQIRAKIPPDAVPVRERIVAGNCTIDVAAGGAIVVVRGDDRLRIPPPARLFRAGSRYYLYRVDGIRAELRVYSLAGENR